MPSCLEELYIKQFFRKAITARLIFLVCLSSFSACATGLLDQRQEFPVPNSSSPDSSYSWHSGCTAILRFLKQPLRSSNTPQGRPPASARLSSEGHRTGCNQPCPSSSSSSFLFFPLAASADTPSTSSPYPGPSSPRHHSVSPLHNNSSLYCILIF